MGQAFRDVHSLRKAPVKDDYKRLSSEWGSKARKEESRARKARLKAQTKKEVDAAKAEAKGKK